MAVLWGPDETVPDLRLPGEALLSSLARSSGLDVAAWVFRKGSSIRLTHHLEPPRLGPEEVRWVRFDAPSLRPRLLGPALAARLIRGPRAARPQALVALGLTHAGRVGATLARILEVPLLTAVVPSDVRAGLDDKKVRAARAASALLAVDPMVRDRLARRGFEAWTASAPSLAEAWRAVADDARASLGQGPERSMSSS